MSANRPQEAILRLTSEFSDLVLEINATDGSPVGLVRGNERVALQTRVALITEGVETRAAQGGLEYLETTTVSLAPSAAQIRDQLNLDSRTFSIPATTTSPDWAVTWHYELRDSTPGLALRLEVISRRDGAVLRNVLVDVTVVVGQLDGWLVQTPGS